MLKRLELVGFKSFADKTQFDFTGGITAIVGPNGSGKSNIVDAVRWILGEQSAKSLRGGEMADVIFNGSSSRRSFGMAEVTMTFDNSHKTLATDAGEVQITRRVYRSGEGEYLINHQLCRLRDIKDLFLGSGAGNDAYSIIEQGRVDVLLQASTKERRTIFEEAAGISRFKAKKTETLRKLERVDQNLQRLRDIRDEVDEQLRKVKLQASKAQRYQEYSQRMQELRVALGLQEYHEFSEHLDAEIAILDGLRTGLADRTARMESGEKDARHFEETLARLEAGVREQDAHLAQSRQQIATEESTLNHEWAQSDNLEKDLAETRRRLSELNARVTELAASANQAAVDYQGAKTLGDEQRQAVRALQEELQLASRRQTELQQQIQADNTAHLELAHQASRLENDVLSLKAHIDALLAECERRRHKNERVAEHLTTIDVELRELTRDDEALQARLAAERQSLAEQRQERDRIRRRCEETNQRIADQRAQRSGLASRIEVLEGLERSHEGLGTGVREVIALLEQPDPGPWRTVLGMIADLLTVRREYAPLIDLALGERAQRFLIANAAALAEALQLRSQPFSGRVSFSEVQRNGEAASADPSALLSTFPEVRPLASFVKCEQPQLAHLPNQLLRNTFLVRDLPMARAMHQAERQLGETDPQLRSHCRLVTRQGELLEPDGTLTVGTHHAETGILSRKSELRELRQQAIELDQQISASEHDLNGLKQHFTALDARVASLQEGMEVLSEQAADLRNRLATHRQKREDLHEEVELSRREITGIEEEIRLKEEEMQRSRTRADEAHQRVRELVARMDHARKEVREREQQRNHRQQEVNTAMVGLAKVEERLKALGDAHKRIETDLEQRRREQAQGEQHVVGARARLQESQCMLLQASAGLAKWYLEKEAAERQLAILTQEREAQRQQSQLLAERTRTARNEWQAQQEQAHTVELKVNDLRHRRDTLSDRLREDYQLDLAELYRLRIADCGLRIEEQPAPSDETALSPSSSTLPDDPQSAIRNPQSIDPAAANEEITELRRKLTRLGNVNLESLQELAELEERARSLQVQYDDLASAQHSLQEIIAKINQDSRRLFTETFNTIKTHFVELFRKLFGGGMADIILEDEADILESGIEIIARPPGKELRSISLMSGGEKTLTAVALLLAIFRSKPSPFCILDEVDAALDEANIGRFTAVIREFLDRSQFILITHSKKTMACADVLYGITMQESGISKRVAVRFEDWPDDDKQPHGNGQAKGGAEDEKSFAGR